MIRDGRIWKPCWNDDCWGVNWKACLSYSQSSLAESWFARPGLCSSDLVCDANVNSFDGIVYHSCWLNNVQTNWEWYNLITSGLSSPMSLALPPLYPHWLKIKGFRRKMHSRPLFIALAQRIKQDVGFSQLGAPSKAFRNWFSVNPLGYRCGLWLLTSSALLQFVCAAFRAMWTNESL